MALVGAVYLIWEILTIQRELDDEVFESEEESECESDCDECGFIIDRLVNTLWPDSNEKCEDCVKPRRNKRWKRR